MATRWWLCGMAAGLSPVLLFGLRSYYPWLLQVFLLTGLVLGAVGGYVMSWIGPILPNWGSRFVAAMLVGSVVSALAAPDLYLLTILVMCVVGALMGILATFFVWLSLHPIVPRTAHWIAHRGSRSPQPLDRE